MNKTSLISLLQFIKCSVSIRLFSWGWGARVVNGYDESVEFKDNPTSVVIGTELGRGHSPQEAYEDLVRKVQGKILVLDSTDETKRREYHLPNGLVP